MIPLKISQPPQSAESNPSTFVRSFFHFLEGEGIRAASLHGGGDGFEGDLSDVDLVVETPAFDRLSGLINRYCESKGWQLCQILRHETTAAFFVCSAADDPSCVVALDVCSDYQRNGTLYLTAGVLLAERTALPWGGHGLTAAIELGYRFAKAAAKGKDPNSCAAEFAGYPEEARERCAAWLKEKWGIDPGEWDSRDVAAALGALRERSNTRPSLFQRGAPARFLRRIAKPTGLVIVTGEADFDPVATRLGKVFGNLYFRRVKKAKRWQAVMLRDLIASTLILVPRLPGHARLVLPDACIHPLDPSQDPDAQHQAIADHLHQRCLRQVARFR